MKASNPLLGAVVVSSCTSLLAGELAEIELQLTKIVDLPFVASDLKCPPDGSNRLFALSLTGEIRIIDVDAGTVDDEVFMQVPGVHLGAGERGAYSIAFHPDFAENGYFYVHHAVARPGASSGNRIVRFTADGGTGGDPGSSLVLLENDKFSNFHFGGSIGFGPDGWLYAAIGDDERFAGSPRENFNLNGKILRMDVDKPSDGKNYGYPPGNPIEAGSGFREILMKGLRNPWRFSFDRSTGDFWVADVGEDSWEEISRLSAYAAPAAPLDLGWPYYEGSDVFDMSEPMPENHVAPIHTYDHSGAFARRSVTGGYVYRGSRFPRMQGIYFFGDYMTASISGLEDDGGWKSRELADFQNFETITTFGEDGEGELYVALSLGVHHLGDTVESLAENLSVVEVGINGDRHFFVTVRGTDGASLRLQRSDNLEVGPWEDIGLPHSAGPTEVTLTDTEEPVPAEGYPRRFYRVVQTVP